MKSNTLRLTSLLVGMLLTTISTTLTKNNEAGLSYISTSEVISAERVSANAVVTKPSPKTKAIKGELKEESMLLVDGRELGCLAMNVYHEGRGEFEIGRYAIAAVTMNRVKSKYYPDTICEVVWQHKQFSWTLYSPKNMIIKEEKSWQRSLEIARHFLTGTADYYSVIGDATHYHADYVLPSWTEQGRLVAHIGAHLFYIL